MSATLVPLNQGAIGQLQGPFNIGQNFNFQAKVIKLGIFIGEKDLMTFNWRFPVDINGERIIISQKGMYEPNAPLTLSLLSFPMGAPASVFIDYVVLEV